MLASFKFKYQFTIISILFYLMVYFFTPACDYARLAPSPSPSPVPPLKYEYIDLACDDEFAYKPTGVQAEYLIFVLTGLDKEGIYAIKAHSLLGGSAGYPFGIFKTDDFINDTYFSESTEHYDFVYNYYLTAAINPFSELLFEVKDKPAKVFYVIRLNTDWNNAFQISLHYKQASIIDTFPDYIHDREIKLNENIAGCFSRVMDRPKDRFVLPDTIEKEKVYKLTIDFDLTNSLTLFDTESSSIDHDYTVNAINRALFQTNHRIVSFFVLPDTYKSYFELSYYPGITYNLRCEACEKIFSMDKFEPDDGPLFSATMEKIIDTNDWENAMYTSEPHTMHITNNPGNEQGDLTDWINFTPLSAATYDIYISLEDTYYDEIIKSTFQINLDMQIIRPDGSSKFDSRYLSITKIPVSPQLSDSYLRFQVPAGPVTSPWFIKINSPSSTDLKYRLCIVKE